MKVTANCTISFAEAPWPTSGRGLTPGETDGSCVMGQDIFTFHSHSASLPQNWYKAIAKEACQNVGLKSSPVLSGTLYAIAKRVEHFPLQLLRSMEDSHYSCFWSFLILLWLPSQCVFTNTIPIVGVEIRSR